MPVTHRASPSVLTISMADVFKPIALDLRS